METLTFTYFDDNGDEIEYSLPANYEVCDRCRGRGVHDHPAFSNGLTREDFDEDPDFQDDYMSGMYDVACEECHGNRVVLEVDRETADPATLALYDDKMQCELESRIEQRNWEKYGY